MLLKGVWSRVDEGAVGVCRPMFIAVFAVFKVVGVEGGTMVTHPHVFGVWCGMS